MLSEMNSFAAPRISPYASFAARHRERIARENPGLSQVQIAEKLAAMWASLGPEQRARYCDPFDEGFKPKGGAAQLVEAVAHAALDIAQAQQPTDPQSFLDWLGAHVVAQCISESGALPRELVECLESGAFLVQHQENIFKRVLEQQNAFAQVHFG